MPSSRTSPKSPMESCFGRLPRRRKTHVVNDDAMGPCVDRKAHDDSPTTPLTVASDYDSEMDSTIDSMQEFSEKEDEKAKPKRISRYRRSRSSESYAFGKNVNRRRQRPITTPGREPPPQDSIRTGEIAANRKIEGHSKAQMESKKESKDRMESKRNLIISHTRIVKSSTPTFTNESSTTSASTLSSKRSRSVRSPLANLYAARGGISHRRNEKPTMSHKCTMTRLRDRQEQALRIARRQRQAPSGPESAHRINTEQTQQDHESSSDDAADEIQSTSSFSSFASDLPPPPPYSFNEDSYKVYTKDETRAPAGKNETQFMMKSPLRQADSDGNGQNLECMYNGVNYADDDECTPYTNRIR